MELAPTTAPTPTTIRPTPHTAITPTTEAPEFLHHVTQANKPTLGGREKRNRRQLRRTTREGKISEQY